MFLHLGFRYLQIRQPLLGNAFAQQEELAIWMPQDVVAPAVRHARIHPDIDSLQGAKAYAVVIHELFGVAKPDRLLGVGAVFAQSTANWELLSAVSVA